MERDKLTRQVEELNAKIAKLPAGKLLCTRNGKYFKWFQSNGIKPTYIPKKHHKIAEAFAEKKYYSLQLEDTLNEIAILNSCLQDYQNCKMKADSFLQEGSGFGQLLDTHLRNFSDEVQQWLAEAYEPNPKNQENCIHQTLAGHCVRSKSEVIIANTLFLNKIPYHYEHGLHLDDMTFFPDFTICHPQTQEIFYWEHFGMMDIPSYCEHTFNKLKIYGAHNIVPSINLITTYETRSHPINSQKIQKQINDFFL